MFNVELSFCVPMLRRMAILNCWNGPVPINAHGIKGHVTTPPGMVTLSCWNGPGRMAVLGMKLTCKTRKTFFKWIFYRFDWGCARERDFYNTVSYWRERSTHTPRLCFVHVVKLNSSANLQFKRERRWVQTERRWVQTRGRSVGLRIFLECLNYMNKIQFV